jgi:maltose alpha-D-glucosyltransferase/alpha-amylase
LGTCEQSNSSALISNQLIFKLYRRLQFGQNPEVELGKFLCKKGFRNTPKLVGHLEYQTTKGETLTLAILQELVANESNAWELAVDRVQHFVNRVASIRETQTPPPLPDSDILQSDELSLPTQFEAVTGSDVHIAQLLGRRTAEMHLKLASDSESSEFKPEPFTPFNRRALVQSIRKLLTQVCQAVRKHAAEIPAPMREEANRLVALESKIGAWIRATLDKKLAAHRIRIHGDYHLGQVLYTGRDYVIIDFEGEPARTMQQRCTKRSALVDVAGMVRSFHYPALSGWNASVEKTLSSQADASEFDRWIESWHRWMSAIYLHSYFRTVQKQPTIVGASPTELNTLLNLYLLEKAIYEVGYELNNRPHWVGIPLSGIRQVLADIGLLT